MGETIGGLLPLAVGVAVSPVPVIAVILMLGTPRARSNGPAFGAGWIVGLVIVTTVVLLLSGGADDADSGTSKVVGWIKVVLGALLLVLAIRRWKGRPQPGAESAMPAWMGAIDTFSPGRSLGLGALLSGVNPKNLSLSFAAASGISQAGLSAGGDVVAVAVYVALASLTVVGPVVASLVAPERARAILATVKDFLASHNAVIMMIVLLVLGAKLVGDGIGILSA